MAIDFTPITFKNTVDGGPDLDSNFTKAQAAFTEALSRTSSTNNEMQVDLDMNNKSLLNADLVQAKDFRFESLANQSLGDIVNEAYHWAQYPEDSLVPEGNGFDEYSAYHYSEKAAESAAEAIDFIEGTEYEFVGNYAADITITHYNQLVRDSSGEFWRVSGSTALPYTTTGAGLPEGGAFVTVGDAALRQQLAQDVSTGNGAALVSGAAIYVGSVAELVSLPSLIDGAHYDVTEYHPGSDSGGGVFYWDSGRNKADHNGGTVIDPNKTFPADWGVDSDVAAWFTADGTGTGCFVRPKDTVINVDWFGARLIPEGALDKRLAIYDVTRSFRAALKSDYTTTGNDDLSIRRTVTVPAWDYFITGEVKIDKGVHLQGVGGGQSRILLPSGLWNSVTNIDNFVLGGGSGGLAPKVTGLHTEGGYQSGSVFKMTSSGAYLLDCFITAQGLGISIEGGDSIVSRCFVENGSRGITITGQNHIIDSCLFYFNNFDIEVADNTFDAQINNCHFEYFKYNAVEFANGSNSIRNVMFSSCQFVSNAQNATSEGVVRFGSNNHRVAFDNCSFRNHRNWAIYRTTGLAGEVKVSNCVIDGKVTNPNYTQSTTARGIDTKNHDYDISGCTFRGLYGEAISSSNSSGVDVSTNISGCVYSNFNSDTVFCNITGVSGNVVIDSVIGDGVTPLVNLRTATQTTKLKLSNNVEWVGSMETIGSEYVYYIPATAGDILEINITANTAPTGNPDYRKSARLCTASHVDFDGTNKRLQLNTATVVSAPGSGYVPAISPSVEFDDGTTDILYQKYAYITVRVPSSYGSVSADFEIV